MWWHHKSTVVGGDQRLVDRINQSFTKHVLY
jgi:hypothetical protein